METGNPDPCALRDGDGFNGATDLHRWKPTIGLCNGTVADTASMGPPIYIGGNNSALVIYISQLQRFNGATDLHRWKRWELTFFHRNQNVLQWGHRFTSVETYSQGYLRCFSGYASMGPPIYIGGNIECGEDFLNVFALQWGHRFTSVETPAIRAAREAGGTGFNGATDLHRWKHLPSKRPPRIDNVASMGPPIYIGGNELFLYSYLIYC